MFSLWLRLSVSPLLLLTVISAGLSSAFAPVAAEADWQIAFFDQYDQQVYIMNADGSERQLFSPYGQGAGRVTCAPNGDHLALLAFDAGDPLLLLADAAGEHIVEIDPMRHGLHSLPPLSLANDGARLIVPVFDQGNSLIQLFDPTMPRFVMLTDARRDYDIAAALAPDGSRVAISSVIAPDTVLLSLVDAGGGDRLPLMDAAVNPAWSPDGSLLVFERLRGPASDREIAVLDVARRLSVTILRPTTMRVYEPTWTPDGRSLLLTGQLDSSTELLRYDFATGALHRLTRTYNVAEARPCALRARPTSLLANNR